MRRIFELADALQEDNANFRSTGSGLTFYGNDSLYHHARTQGKTATRKLEK